MFLAGAAAAGLACAYPASAQQADTSASDLRCATWAALVVGSNQDNEEVRTAFSMALVWFLGRYEAATGVRFEEAMTPAYIESLGPDLPAVEQECRPRMQEMGDRLSVMGAKLQAAGS